MPARGGGGDIAGSCGGYCRCAGGERGSADRGADSNDRRRKSGTHRAADAVGRVAAHVEGEHARGELHADFAPLGKRAGMRRAEARARRARYKSDATASEA